jgi:predicted nucleotide-binding protein with TIR-like domain
MTAKPTMFIGSSVEGKTIAETIQVLLDYDVASTIWHQGVFELSSSTLETLIEALPEYDFATLVLTADDLVEKRDHTAKAPRDNVIFELGLFMGALGRRRTFVVHSRDNSPMLPTDLAGITMATYEPRSNLDAALGPVCTKIKRAIERAGARPRGSAPSGPDPALAALQSTVTEQGRMLSLLFQRLESAPASPSPRGGFDFLAGAWLNTDDRTSLYVEVTDKPRLVYCYEGDDEATGEYYAFRQYGDDLMGRFRWFQSQIDGYFWLHIDSPDRLSGGWWMNEDLSMAQRADLALLKNARQTNKMSWVRVPDKQPPPWARQALDDLRAGRPVLRVLAPPRRRP